MFADHIHYREYQQLLVDLHGLIAAGRNQSPDARDLRQRMERAEEHLSEDEIVRLNALSADLSMTHDREIPDPEILARVVLQEVPRLIESAYKSGQWDDVLELLRAGGAHHWRADQIAYARSRAYEGLAELAPAVAFMDEAARRAPGNSNYRVLALRLLWQSKRYQQAYSRAREYLAEPATKTRLVLMSGGIIAQRSLRVPEPPDLNAIANLALHRMRQALPQESSPNLIFSGLISLGLLSVQVDDTNSAVDAFREALGVETTSDAQVTSSWTLNKELELVQTGKTKTAEERSNARQLAQFVQPLPIAVPA
jgi:tetratricopeptide (TPR) repeat protein